MMASIYLFGSILALMALCLAIALIDRKALIIPDRLNLALAAVGLSSACLFSVPTINDALFGAFTGAASAWGLRIWYRRIRGIDGLGLGDVKLISAAGCWTGATALAPMLFLASITGLAYCAVRRLQGRSISTSERIPFGPFLVAGLMAVAVPQTLTGHSIFTLIDRVIE